MGDFTRILDADSLSFSAVVSMSALSFHHCLNSTIFITVKTTSVVSITKLKMELILSVWLWRH